MTGTYEYDAFGAARAQTGAPTEWSYTGEQNDPTGLEYLRARYYDASTGRFLSQDPLPLLQRYAYVSDNPANLVDPSGLFPGQDRFQQLMAAEQAIQAATKQILADAACWKTHMFCPHPALIWKAAKKAGRCAVGVAVIPSDNCFAQAADAMISSPAADWVARQICPEKYYADLNVTAGFGLVATAGVQCTKGQGFHFYRGLGVGAGASASVTLGPRQTISTGVFCGLQGTYGTGRGITVQGGIADLFGHMAGFWEIGGFSQFQAGVSGSLTCADVQ